jgi:hypothetical protein
LNGFCLHALPFKKRSTVQHIQKSLIPTRDFLLNTPVQHRSTPFNIWKVSAMYDLERLESAIEKLSTCPKWQRRVIEKEILLRGGRVYQWTKETTDLLSRQLRWLDTQTESPTYEDRFTAWTKLLHEYERACDALAAAAGLEIGVAA